MRRRILIRATPMLASLVAGIVVLAIAGASTVVFVIGFVLTAMPAVLLVSLFFYEVGASEDRQRAREQRRGSNRGMSRPRHG